MSGFPIVCLPLDSQHQLSHLIPFLLIDDPHALELELLCPALVKWPACRIERYVDLNKLQAAHLKAEGHETGIQVSESHASLSPRESILQ